MNKNGYTIMELVVGLALLSIIIVFMMMMLVNLKMKEDKNGIDTKALTLEATMTKTINSDINKKEVLAFSEVLSSNSNEQTLRIDFMDNTYKLIRIINNNKIIYGTETSIDIEKTLPNGYEVSNAFVENNSYGLSKIVIEVENKNNEKMNFNIEAYSYNNSIT